MMKRSILVFSMMAIVAFLVYNLSVSVDASKGDLVLTAKKVKSAPADAWSPQWNKAKEADIMLTGAGSVEGKNLELKAKAVY
ncbi:MAG: hypothetical protein JRJ29_22665, partial [Deltaproteobacteria bacterium]|nr:hypothetical protein [Deltaproteobacteria bacterium]